MNLRLRSKGVGFPIRDVVQVTKGYVALVLNEVRQPQPNDVLQQARALSDEDKAWLIDELRKAVDPELEKVLEQARRLPVESQAQLISRMMRTGTDISFDKDITTEDIVTQMRSVKALDGGMILYTLADLTDRKPDG